MKTSLNGARLGADKLGFVDFIDLAARHGFDGIDFSISAAQKAAVEVGGVDDLSLILRNAGVAAAVFGLEVEWRRDEKTYQEGMATLEEQARFAQRIGANRCTTWMPPAVNDLDRWERDTIRRFSEIARVLHAFDIRLGLEWVGPHHLRAEGANPMGSTPWIHTLPATLKLIDSIGIPSVGLLVDSYHCYTTGIGEKEIAELNDSSIVHVHINDAPKGVGPIGALDGNRVLPGDGEIDLAGFLRGLRAAQYQGYIAAEILAPGNIAEDPDTAASLVRAALQKTGV